MWKLCEFWLFCLFRLIVYCVGVVLFGWVNIVYLRLVVGFCLMLLGGCLLGLLLPIVV